MRAVVPALVALLVAVSGASAAQPESQKASAPVTTPDIVAQSRHEGYYYPKISSHETYKAQTRVLPNMDRPQRLLFISAMTKEQTETGYAPRYVIFAKGDDAEKLIIVSLDDQTLGTIYRARAVMAAMTSLARLSPMLKDANLDDQLNFYDVMKMMGFRQITISDGKSFAHRVELK